MPPELAAVRAVAGSLLGVPVGNVVLAPGGANNLVYRVDCAEGPLALKFYPRRSDDPRARRATEYEALRFLGEHGVSGVARAVAFGHAGRGLDLDCAVYEWIDGAAVTADAAAVDEAATLLRALRDLGSTPEAAALGPASHACLSIAATVAQIEERLAPLRGLVPERPELARFLAEELGPAVGPLTRRALDATSASGLDPELALPRAEQCLSPSDFGFHNAVRRPDGRLVFIDFEYFGWDDPAKLTSDFLLHPGMALPSELQRRFHAAACALYGELAGGDAFRARLRAVFPLHALIWCLIVLNAFLPAQRQRRAALGGAEHGVVEAHQLLKARRQLHTLREAHDRGPDFL